MQCMSVYGFDLKTRTVTEEAELHITAAQLGCSCLEQCLRPAPPGFPEATLQLLHGALPTHAAHDMGKSDFKSSGEVRGDAGFASSLPDNSRF